MKDTRTMRKKMWGCCASTPDVPCIKARVAGSPFCKEHKKKHDNSPWTKAWKKYMADVSKVGTKKAVFVSPSETKVVRDAPVD